MCVCRKAWCEMLVESYKRLIIVPGLRNTDVKVEKENDTILMIMRERQGMN